MSNVLFNKSYSYNASMPVSYETVNVGTTSPVELKVTSLGVISNGVVTSNGITTNTVTKTFFPDKNGNVVFFNGFGNLRNTVVGNFPAAAVVPNASFFKVEKVEEPTYFPAPAPTPRCKTLIYDYTGGGEEITVGLRSLMPNGVMPINASFSIQYEQAIIRAIDKSGKRTISTSKSGSKDIVMSPNKDGEITLIHKGLTIAQSGGTPGTVVCKVYANLLGACVTPTAPAPTPPPLTTPTVVETTVNYTDVIVMVPSTNNTPVDVTQPYIVTNYIIKY